MPKEKAMENTVTGLVFVLFQNLISVVTSSCAALSDVPSEDLAYLGASDAVNGTYATGAVTVFKCDGSAGFGYVTYTCQDDHMWGSPSRECDDPVDFGVGSMVGVGTFGLALVIVIVFMVASSVSGKEEKPATPV